MVLLQGFREFLYTRRSSFQKDTEKVSEREKGLRRRSEVGGRVCKIEQLVIPSVDLSVLCSTSLVLCPYIEPSVTTKTVNDTQKSLYEL